MAPRAPRPWWQRHEVVVEIVAVALMTFIESVTRARSLERAAALGAVCYALLVAWSDRVDVCLLPGVVSVAYRTNSLDAAAAAADERHSATTPERRMQRAADKIVAQFCTVGIGVVYHSAWRELAGGGAATLFLTPFIFSTLISVIYLSAWTLSHRARCTATASALFAASLCGSNTLSLTFLSLVSASSARYIARVATPAVAR